MYTTPAEGWSAAARAADDIFGLPELDHATVAGIAVAISGNVLISFALNCQKLAHRRLELEREHASEQARNGVKPRATPPAPLEEEDEEDGEVTPTGQRPYGVQHLSEENMGVPPAMAVLETRPLLDSSSEVARYDSSDAPKWTSRLSPWRKRVGKLAREADRAHLGSSHSLVPVDVVSVRPGRRDKGGSSRSDVQGNESDYLKSKLWWLGFSLMNVGEMGNFISYAFAPASIVAPLGTFALIANCFFAPLMLKERFRKRDVLGIFIAIIGAVTVVLSANSSDTRLDPDGLIRAITQKPFIAYSIIYAVLAIVLSSLSQGNIGQRYVFVDVGLCAVFGGFTVLSTKALSTLLTREWFEIFTEWITYPVIAMLLGTGIGQIKYLNRALMRFDSKVVVPTQFVMFNLSAIVGSAILYGDFKKASFHQVVTFLYGCAATFAGVFVIAWAPSGSDDGQSQDGHQDVEAATVNGEDRDVLDLRMGSLSRRNRATLVIPEGVVSSPQSTPILRRKQSVVSLIGLSPAQRVLLVHNSPRDEFMHIPADYREETHGSDSSQGRRRTMSWADGGPPARRGNRVIRSNVASREASQTRSTRTAT